MTSTLRTNDSPNANDDHLSSDQLAWVQAHARQVLGLVPTRVALLTHVLRQRAPFSLADVAKRVGLTTFGVRDALLTFEKRGIILVTRERHGGPRPDHWRVAPGPSLRPLLG